MRIYTNIMGMNEQTNQTKPNWTEQPKNLHFCEAFRFIPSHFRLLCVSLLKRQMSASKHTHTHTRICLCVFVFDRLLCQRERKKWNTRRKKEWNVFAICCKNHNWTHSEDTMQTPKDHVHIENYIVISFRSLSLAYSLATFFFILLKSKHKIIQKHKWGKTQLYWLRLNNMGRVFV